MTADPLLVVGVHDCFGGGTNSDMFCEICFPGFCDPGDFRCESLDMVFFLLEDGF